MKTKKMERSALRDLTKEPCSLPALKPFVTGVLVSTLALALSVSALAGNPANVKPADNSSNSKSDGANHQSQSTPRVLNDPFAGLLDWGAPSAGVGTDPLAMMNQMQQRMRQQMAQMDKLFAQSFGGAPGRQNPMSQGPAGGQVFGGGLFANPFAALDADMTLDDQGDKYIVTLNQPDLEKYKFNVTVEDNVVTVTGTRQEVQRQTDDQTDNNAPLTSQSEYNESFTRSLALPSAVDPAQVNVETKNGELIISLEKSPDPAGQSSSRTATPGAIRYRQQKPTHIGGKVI